MDLPRLNTSASSSVSGHSAFQIGNTFHLCQLASPTSSSVLRRGGPWYLVYTNRGRCERLRLVGSTERCPRAIWLDHG